jgi:hypothetical protein
MSDDRYTVDDPPKEGGFVYLASTFSVANRKVGDGLIWVFYDANDRLLLESGLLHRTPESAEAHAKRMLMVDEILGSVEKLATLITRSGTERIIAAQVASCVIAKARGEDNL